MYRTAMDESTETRLTFRASMIPEQLGKGAQKKLASRVEDHIAMSMKPTTIKGWYIHHTELNWHW